MSDIKNIIESKIKELRVHETRFRKVDNHVMMNLVSGQINVLDELLEEIQANGADKSTEQALNLQNVSNNEVTVCVHPFKFVVIHGSRCHCLKCGHDIDTQTNC